MLIYKLGIQHHVVWILMCRTSYFTSCLKSRLAWNLSNLGKWALRILFNLLSSGCIWKDNVIWFSSMVWTFLFEVNFSPPSNFFLKVPWFESVITWSERNLGGILYFLKGTRNQILIFVSQTTLKIDAYNLCYFSFASSIF